MQTEAQAAADHAQTEALRRLLAGAGPWQRRKKRHDRIARTVFATAGLIAAAMIVLIFFFVASRGVKVFLPLYEGGVQRLGAFLTGLRWRQDQAVYGVGFIMINTLITALGASLLAFPTSVLSALLITKIAPKRVSAVLTTIVELLAAIPSVVFGVFASGKITALVDGLAQRFGLTTFAGNSMLAVIILLAMMIYPTITSLAIVAIRSVPKSLEDGSLALGASKTQTNFKVVLSAAKSGIFAGLVLGLGRAFGEATAVSMVAGNAFTGPTWNPFMITRTLTSTMLSGLKETTGLDYDIRFSVGIVLMLVILASNALIHAMKRRIGGVTHE